MAEVISGKQFPFLWEGKDKKGNKIKGRGLAKDELELRADLRRQGFTPLVLHDPARRSEALLFEWR